MNFEIAPKSTELRLSWDDAMLYCFSLEIDGKVGWRLPTKDELNEIYKSDNDFVGNVYWSSTESDGYNAWDQNFNNGFQYPNYKNFNSYVRAARSIT
jgi:hypothetical protein